MFARIFRPGSGGYAISYQPHFRNEDFRAPSEHYALHVKGKRILYAYIRKNACTAFKLFINRRRHPKFVIKTLLGREKNDRYNISGNMKYYAFRGTAEAAQAWADEVIFVHRDPLERFISIFSNKFVDNDGAEDIRQNFETVTGRPFEQATFDDFLDYARNDFDRLDCHMWPQKAHLWDMCYTRPIAIQDLGAEMASLAGTDISRQWFERKVNRSAALGGAGESLTERPVHELRALRDKGAVLGKTNFMSEKARSIVAERYRVDYEMQAALARVPLSVGA